MEISNIAKIMFQSTILHLVGIVIDMSPTCRNVGQMSENFEKDTNVHDMENFFILSHVSVACRGHKS